jgi:putative ABC transport system permease protein
MRLPIGTRLRVAGELAFVESCRALVRHKLRTALTALGITIGVAAVIWVTAIGRTGTERAQAELEKLGDNLVWLEAGSRNINGVRSGNRGLTTLTPEDAEAIRREIPLISRVAENVDGSMQIIGPAANWNARFRGVASEYLEVKRWQIADGAFFTDDHVRRFDSVIVLGDTVARRLFADAHPVGEMVRMHDNVFEVIGVLAKKGISGTGQDQDDVVMLPWTTAQKKLLGRTYTHLDDILCSARTQADVLPAIDAVVALMRQRHHIRVGEEDDFNIRRPDELIKTQVAAQRTMEALLIGLAAISLLVGGIGVMNVMLASVVQRTNEIGLRLAIGATEGAVRLQFLGEAVMICVLASLLGVLVAFAGAFVIEDALGWALQLPIEGAVAAAAFAIGIGVLFGVYPAWRASSLDPITALHRE